MEDLLKADVLRRRFCYLLTYYEHRRTGGQNEQMDIKTRRLVNVLTSNSAYFIFAVLVV